MDDRARALNEIVVAARRYGLSAAEIAEALGDRPGAPHERRRGVLIRVLGVLGGIFVFAGIGVFIGLRWDELNSAARVIVTLGSGIAALVLALLAGRDTRFETATTPLFLVAAALEPTGMLVAFDEFGSGGDWRWAALLTAGAMALQFATLFSQLRQATLVFVCVLFSVLFWWTVFDLLDIDETAIMIVLGMSILLAALGLDRTPYRDITPPWYLIGGAVFLYGFFDAVEDTALEISFMAVAVGLVYLSAVVHSRTLLFVSTLAILAYTAWFTGQHFAESVGWPLALVAFGLFMIGLSALAVRIDRDYVRVNRV